jgi:hypothetical protein
MSDLVQTLKQQQLLPLMQQGYMQGRIPSFNNHFQIVLAQQHNITSRLHRYSSPAKEWLYRKYERALAFFGIRQPDMETMLLQQIGNIETLIEVANLTRREAALELRHVQKYIDIAITQEEQARAKKEETGKQLEQVCREYEACKNNADATRGEVIAAHRSSRKVLQQYGLLAAEVRYKNGESLYVQQIEFLLEESINLLEHVSQRSGFLCSTLTQATQAYRAASYTAQATRALHDSMKMLDGQVRSIYEGYLEDIERTRPLRPSLQSMPRLLQEQRLTPLLQDMENERIVTYEHDEQTSDA